MTAPQGGRILADMTNLRGASIAPLRRSESLRESVLRQIRAAIISGEMAPGEVHSAPALGARFGISPTPVREAMLDLANEGLVRPVRNKGFQITEISDHDLDDLTTLRLLLEPPTLRDVVPVIPEDDLPGLRSLAQGIVDAATAEDLVGYLEIDRRFHLQLLGYSGNAQLVEIVSRLRSRTRLYGLSSLLERGILPNSAEEHHRILDAVAARDAEGAFRLLQRHISHVRGIWAGASESDEAPAEDGS